MQEEILCGGNGVKTIIKIEVVLLVLLLIAAAGVTLMVNGMLVLEEPVIMQRTPAPIQQDEQTAEMASETVPVTTAPPDQAEPPQVAATRYFAYDVRTEEYLRLQGDVNEKLYPASITKLLTSYVVLQYLDPESTVVVGDALTLVDPDSSVAELQEGDELTVEQLIAGMMMPSGNDAAQVAAVETGRAIAEDSSLDAASAKEIFVDEMNRQAQLLGMENSHFVSPDGWHDEDHYTTMADLVTLAKVVLNNQTMLKYTSLATQTVVLNGREVEWENTNFLLYEDKGIYVPSTIGLKTGYTEAAGGCLVSAFFETDRIILIGVFGGPGFTMDRYVDTAAIYDSL